MTQLPTKEEWADFEAYVQRIEQRVKLLERMQNTKTNTSCGCGRSGS